MQVVLQTIAAGETVTRQPAEQRILGEYPDTAYGAALAQARAVRVTAYQHRDGEVRLVSDAAMVGCAYTNPALFQWLHQATALTVVSYAIVTDHDSPYVTRESA